MHYTLIITVAYLQLKAYLYRDLLSATSDLAGITVEKFCCTHGMHVVQDTQKFKTGTQLIREFRNLSLRLVPNVLENLEN